MSGLLPARTSRMAAARVPSGNSAGRSGPAASPSHICRKLAPDPVSAAPALAALSKRRRVIIVSCLVRPPAPVGLAAGHARARLQKRSNLFQRQTGARRGIPRASERSVNPAQGVTAMNPGRTNSVRATAPRDVEGPVQVVFDAPMASCGLREGCGRERAGGDVGSPFGLDFVAALDAAFEAAVRM